MQVCQYTHEDAILYVPDAVLHAPVAVLHSPREQDRVEAGDLAEDGGRHNLRVWHEDAGARVQDDEVGEGHGGV